MVAHRSPKPFVRVRVLLPLPSAINPNFITVIGDTFGFIVFISQKIITTGTAGTYDSFFNTVIESV